ncbi:MAG: O-antigen ligase family protein [Candidatus Hydrogenedentes bacterium]|nr:O-antigen ligase family protein [Candidatus Hydrogenedentota bacterium]
MALTEFVQMAGITHRRGAAVGAATLAAAGLAAVLAIALDLPWTQAGGLPLLVLGLYLVAFHTHAALCFIAFAITPFCVVQAEVLGVTLNLPEVLILALAAKEGVRLLRDGFTLPEALPHRTLAAFVAASVIAIATGFHHQNGAVRTLQDFRQFVEFLLLFGLVLRCVSGRDEAIRIAFCFALGGSLIALHGIMQQVAPLGVSPTQMSSDLRLYGAVRSASFYGPTPLGGLMVLAIGPAAGVLLASKRRSIQWIMAACILLCLVTIVLTRTRGSWLGLAVALALIAVSIRPSGKTLFAAAGAGIVLAFLLGPVVLQRLYTLADPVQDVSLMARAQYYAAAAHIGRAHPVLGLGWGCFYDIDTILNAERYVPVTMEEVAAREAEEAAERRAFSDPGEDAPPEPAEVEEATVHSAYLQLFVKTGLLGVLTFLAIIVVWVERIWRGRNTRFQSDSGHALFIGITASVAGYLFHSTFENFFQWPVMAQSFWLLFGLSFMLAPRPEGVRPGYGVPLAFVCSASAVFLLFMAACLRMETLHPGHYERNVTNALDEGDLEKAIRIARRATEVGPREPMPYTVHARLLFLRGDDEAALAELDKAFGPKIYPNKPRFEYTTARYYFAPARLLLGRHHAERDDWDEARQQFELARAYADLRADEFAEFHPLLYQAYASAGNWFRALDFGAPDADELAGLDGASLVNLARAAETRGAWALLERVASAIQTRDGLAEQAGYFLGRARLAQGKPAEAVEPLKEAADAGLPDAHYHLGRALAETGQTEAAVAAFRATPPHDIHHAVALAEAWGLLPENDAAAAELRAGLMEAVRRMRQLPPAPGEDAATPALLAYVLPGGGMLPERFPMLLLWGDSSGALDRLTGVSVARDADGCTVQLEGTGLLLEVRTVENLAVWAAIEHAGETDEIPAGWIDTAREWFALTDRPAGAVTREPDGNLAMDVNGTAWIYSAPARIPEGALCLVSARLRDPAGAARYGLQQIDAASRVIGGAALAAWEPIPAWSERSVAAPASPACEAVRFAIETNHPDARAALDDPVIIAIPPPPGGAD